MDLSGTPGAPRGWQHWLREARAAAARGDYRAAIHAAYWAAIAHLEETKSLPEDRARTPRESLRLIRPESAELRAAVPVDPAFRTGLVRLPLRQRNGLE